MTQFDVETIMAFDPKFDPDCELCRFNYALDDEDDMCDDECGDCCE